MVLDHFVEIDPKWVFYECQKVVYFQVDSAINLVGFQVDSAINFVWKKIDPFAINMSKVKVGSYIC